MNTSNEMSEEQLTKAAEACENAYDKGFLAHCKAAGFSDTSTLNRHKLAVRQREHRATKQANMRSAILGY